MATKKQIEANRRNAKKSTGPRSAPGKARAARNALTHGLTAREPVLHDEDGAQFHALQESLMRELRAESPLERFLVQRIAAAQWRLARVPMLEAELLDRLRRAGDPAVPEAEPREASGLAEAWQRDGAPYGGALARLSRYETMLERSVLRLLGELRQLQEERRELGQRARAAAGASAERTMGRPGPEGDRARQDWWDELGEEPPPGTLLSRPRHAPVQNEAIAPARPRAGDPGVRESGPSHGYFLGAPLRSRYEE